MSATPDSTLANPEQLIADLQRQLAEREAELAECKAERDEALEQQTATAEVLQVINSSPGELKPVFDAMLEKAMRLCQAAFGGLFIWEGERLRAVATRGLSERLDDFVRQGFKANATRLIHGEAIEHIVDLTQEPLGGRPGGAAAVELGGARTMLNVALRKDDVLLGSFSVFRQEVRPFSDKEIALLQNFAAQAVIAMENARLLAETREALEQQTATAEVLQVINSSPGDLAPVFDAILEKAHSLCGADHGSLFLQDGEIFRAIASRGMPEAMTDPLREGIRANDSSLARPLMAGEPFVHVHDSALDEHPNWIKRALDVVSSHRTLLSIPLRKSGTLLGMIVAGRFEIRPFTDKQIALLQNFASQAVIAMENARLITETREALEQQTATAEVLGVINSSPGDLAPVFDAMLDKAIRLCDTAFGIMQTYDGEAFRTVALDGERFHVAAVQGDPEFTQWARGYGPFAPADPSSPAGRIVSGEEVVRFADAPEEEALRISPGFRALVEASGMRSGVILALRKDGTLRGNVTVYRQEVRPFSDKQIALLQNFAAQAVIAMENARLLTETREALEQQTATAEVLQVINSSPGDLAPVFDAVVEKAMRLCEATNGHLFTYDGDRLHPAAIHGDPRLVEWHRQLGPFRPAANTGLERIQHGERLVHIADVREVDVFRTVPEPREAAEISGFRSALNVALRRDDVLLGVLGVYRREVRPFSDKQIALLQNFAAQAVIAMENARLIRELHQRTDQIAELNRGLEARVAEQVEELGRVGRLKRFLAPQLAELIVSQGNEKILESHRREIVVVFCDLRGYTAFTETAEPEEVLDFLREYHGALGPLVAQFEGTLDQFSGDGIMVFFNDPVPCPDPAERAVAMAVAMREAAGALIAKWRRRGRELGFGAGIAQGYATLGQIGFAERSGYTAIGTVCNLAARLCAEAKDGQILVAQRVALAVEETTALEEIGALAVKGLTQPVVAFNVPPAAIQPTLRVIEGGPQSV
jgi:GAF domain-containing protein